MPLDYGSTKTFEHVVSTAFRQWKAKSHCNQLHGYGLTFHIEFGCQYLDGKNWVVDFGDLKALKQKLENAFDHKTVVANDDPDIDWFIEAARKNILTLRRAPEVGCEAFAQHAYTLAQDFLLENYYTPRVFVLKVECREHSANSAFVRWRD